MTLKSKKQKELKQILFLIKNSENYFLESYLMFENKISQFENPKYHDYQQEKRRILASTVVMCLPYTAQEFYQLFWEFITKRMVHFEEINSRLKPGQVIIIHDEHQKPHHYQITKNEINEECEFALLDEKKIFKINLQIQEKGRYSLEIKYSESIRYQETIEAKKHQKMQAKFHADFVNKAIVLKKYFIGKVKKM